MIGAVAQRPLIRTAAVVPTAAPRKVEAPLQPFRPEPGTIVGGVNEGRVAGSVVLAILFFVPALAALLVSLPFALIGGAAADNFLTGFTETWRWIQRHVFFLFHTPMQYALNNIGQAFVISPFLVKKTAEGREITVRVFLEGAAADVAKPKRFAKEMSEHLSIPGTKVNVVFVDQPDEYAMTIPVHKGGVSYALSWNADDGADVFAHELMHRLGLLDEYSHSNHFTNANAPASFKFTRIFERLYQPDIPKDAGQGIMQNDRKKPLPRHYDEILRKAGIDA